MRITPLDVRKQEFRKVVRGLDGEEVYAFLATLADEYEAVLNDNKQLREKVIELDEKVSEYRNMEKTLRDTLLTAERVMTEARQNARKEADLVLRDAHLKAEQQTAAIASRVDQLKSQLRELRGHRDAFLARLRGLSEAQIALVESYQKDFAQEDSSVADATSGPSPSPIPDPLPASRAETNDEDHWRDYALAAEAAERAAAAEAVNRSEPLSEPEAPPMASGPVEAVPEPMPEPESVSAPMAPMRETVDPPMPMFTGIQESGPAAGDSAERPAVSPAPADASSGPFDPVDAGPAPEVEETVMDQAQDLAAAVAEISSREEAGPEATPIHDLSDFGRAVLEPEEGVAGQPTQSVAPSPSPAPETPTDGPEPGVEEPMLAETSAVAQAEEEGGARWSLSRFTRGLGGF